MKKKVLLILPRKIFPTIGGYENNRKELIKILHKYYILTVVIISTSDISEPESSFFTANTNSFQHIKIPKWRHVINAFWALFSKTPLQARYFYFKKVQRIVDKYSTQQDIVIGSLIRSMKYFVNLTNKNNPKIVCDMGDSIGTNYKRSAKYVSSLFWKTIYNIEYKRLLVYEKYWVSHANATMLWNWEECNFLKQYGNAHLMPHGVNEKLFEYNKKNDKYSNCVSFIGRMDVQPNIDAVNWYVTNVHSKIGNKVPFVILGANPTKDILLLSKTNKNIIVTGFVDDPFEILNSSIAVVAPMQTGAGIQNKVLEAMALGTINILSPLAAKPIYAATNNKHFLVARNADEFCNKILDIAKNADKYKGIKQAAQEFIANNYTWNKYEKEYCKVLDNKL